MKSTKMLVISALSVLTLLSGCATTSTQSLSDGFGKILNKTSTILNSVAGTGTTSTTTQRSDTYATPASNMDNLRALTPLIQEYKIPNKETSQYKIEDLVIQIRQGAFEPQAFISGKFYNKTNDEIIVSIKMPTYDKEGFQQWDLSISVRASAKQKSKIDTNLRLRSPDSRPDVKKIKYTVCGQIGVVC